jgi:hypothetical protein
VDAGADVRRPYRRYRKRESTAKVACVPCVKAKAKCGFSRPCERCVNKGCEQQCVDRDQSEIPARRKPIKLRVPACDECKASKAACDDQSCCKRCQRLELPCVRRPGKRKMNRILQSRADEVKGAASDDAQYDDDDDVSMDESEFVVKSEASVPSTPPRAEASLEDAGRLLRMVKSMSTNAIFETQAPSYVSGAMFQNYSWALESYSPFQIADFLAQSQVAKFTAFLGVLLYYLPREQCLQFVNNMWTFGAEVCTVLTQTANRQRIMEPVQSLLPAPLIEKGQALMSKAVVLNSGFAGYRPVRVGIHTIPYVVFPKFLLSRQMGFLCIDYTVSEMNQTVQFEISMCPFAETLFGYTSEEVSRLCAMTSLTPPTSDCHNAPSILK